MTELSPAQKALDAFNERYELCGPFDDDWVEQCLAAALRVAADQVSAVQWEGRIEPDAMHSLGINWTCDALLAIAAELEAQ